MPGDEADLTAFDESGQGTGLAGSDRRVRGNLVMITKWAQEGAALPSPSGHSRRLTVRFWLKPVEILGTERADGITVERTAIDASGALRGTGEFETLPVQMVLRSVGYQSVPLPDVPFDARASIVPNAQGRVLGPDGVPRPGEYVAGWLKRGPTGVIGTNKSDAAETVRCLFEDLAGGPAPARSRRPARACSATPRPRRGAVAAGQRARRTQHRTGLLRRMAPHRGRRGRPGQGTRPRRAGQAPQPRGHLVRLPSPLRLASACPAAISSPTAAPGRHAAYGTYPAAIWPEGPGASAVLLSPRAERTRRCLHSRPCPPRS